MTYSTDTYCGVTASIDAHDAEQDRRDLEVAAHEAARADARQLVAEAILRARRQAGAGPRHHLKVRELSSRAWAYYFQQKYGGFKPESDPNP